MITMSNNFETEITVSGMFLGYPARFVEGVDVFVDVPTREVAKQLIGSKEYQAYLDGQIHLVWGNND